MYYINNSADCVCPHKRLLKRCKHSICSQIKKYIIDCHPFPNHDINSCYCLECNLKFILQNRTMRCSHGIVGNIHNCENCNLDKYDRVNEIIICHHNNSKTKAIECSEFACFNYAMCDTIYSQLDSLHETLIIPMNFEKILNIINPEEIDALINNGILHFYDNLLNEAEDIFNDDIKKGLKTLKFKVYSRVYYMIFDLSIFYTFKYEIQENELLIETDDKYRQMLNIIEQMYSKKYIKLIEDNYKTHYQIFDEY